MLLPITDSVARICKNSTLDPLTKRPTPNSFEFRKVETWKDSYLSVYWLEYLQPETVGHPTKLATLRRFLLSPGLMAPVARPTKNNALAVVQVAAIHGATLADPSMTTMECQHEPQWSGDPHSGIHPNPTVDQWPTEDDWPAHLAVQQFLFLSMCHWEPGIISEVQR